MSSSPELESTILTLIGDHVLELSDDFGLSENLFDAGMDSMAIMQFLLVMEEHLDVAIEVGEVTKENFRSAKTIAELVRQKKGTGEASPIAEHDPKTEHEVVAKPVEEPPSPLNYPEGDVISTLTESDCFVRANDKLMVKTGQGLHSVSSVLELEAMPDIERLRAAMSGLMARHPMLAADYKQKFFGVPVFVRGKGAAEAVPLHFWSEDRSSEKLKAYEPGTVSSAEACLENLASLTESDFNKNGRCHIRCDLIEKRDENGFLFVLTWRHLILDGVGAEFLCREVDHIARGIEGAVVPPLDDAQPEPPLPWSERYRKARPMIDFINNLRQEPFRSFAGRKPQPGALRFQTLELDSERSAKVFARGEALCGPVLSTPFHVACAVRAHDAVWQARGVTEMPYMITVPMQFRRKGAKGPIFQNHLTMLFLTATADEAKSIEKMVVSLQKQQEFYLKERLGERFQEMQRMMQHMPPWLYTNFIRMHMRGEMTSFFFSGTGTFAAEMETFAGANIRNAYHVPSINRPPGTGLFINDKNGIVTLVLSYREGVISQDEAQLMMASYAEGLTGEDG